MAAYAELKAMSPFTMEGTYTYNPDYNIKLEIVGDDDGGTKRSERIPPLTLTNAEGTALALTEFDNVSENYAFNADDKYKFFRKILEGSVRQDWDATIAGTAKTNNNFVDARATILRRQFDNDSIENYDNYIRAYSKPKFATARITYNRFKVLELYRKLLPTATERTELEQKRLFVNMFPSGQYRSLKRSHPVLNDTSFETLVTFFSTFDQINTSRSTDGNKRKNNRDHNGDSGGHDDTRGDSGSYRNRKKNRKNKKPNNNNTNNSSTTGAGGNGNMCRIPEHAALGERNHTWHKCIFNRNGPNYNAERDRRRREQRTAANQGQRANGNTPGQSGQQYHQQQQFITGFPQAAAYHIHPPGVTSPAAQSYGVAPVVYMPPPPGPTLPVPPPSSPSSPYGRRF